MTSVEILDKKAQLKKRAYEMINTCKVEIRDLSVEEADEFNGIKDELNNLNSELRKLEIELIDNTTETELRDITNNNTKSIKTNQIMEFKLLKAINDVANNRSLDEATSAVVNKGTEEMRNSGLSFGGQIQLPVSELRADITVTAEGTDVVAVDMYDILEPLRAKNVLVQAGAKFLGGLVGDVQVPVMSASNVTWEAETASASDGAGTFTNVKLTPKRLTAYIDISKQFLNQTSAQAEALIRQDLINAINSKLEATILGTGAGSTTQPAGLFTGTISTTISDYGDLADLEADIEDANINGACSYVASNKAKAALRTMIKGTNGTGMVLEAGTIDGTPVYNTSNVSTTKGIAYGDFSNLAIGQWGSIDLTVDPYTVATQGKVRLVVNAYFDAKVLRNGAIKVATVA